MLSILGRICASKGHQFWAADVRLREVLESGAVIPSAQVADVYLLGLAAYHGGKLATLDRRIPAAVVRGGPAALETIPT